MTTAQHNLAQQTYAQGYRIIRVSKLWTPYIDYVCPKGPASTSSLLVTSGLVEVWYWCHACGETNRAAGYKGQCEDLAL